jgi:hypothetical protein
MWGKGSILGRRKVLAAVQGLALLGCSTQSLTATSELLKVSMVGVFERTPDGVGNAEPKRILFTLKGMDFLKDDGTTVDIWEGADETTHRVISRPQIVFEKKISDYVGTTFMGLRLTFDETITGAGKYESELAASLPDPRPKFIQSLKVEKGQGMAITVNIQWKDTITRDSSATPPTETMTPPSLRFSLED